MKDPYQLVAEFRLKLLRRDAAARAELLRSYQKTFKSIELEIKSVATKLLSGDTPSLLYQRARLNDLQRQVQESINTLSTKAATLTVHSQQLAVTEAKEQAVKLIAAQTQKALELIPTDSASAKKLIEEAGFKFLGTQEAIEGADWHMFNDPETGSTLMLQTVTPKTIAAKLEESRAKWTSADLGTSFSTLPTKAIENLVGVAHGNPIHEVFGDIAEELGSVTADRIKSAMVRGIALGESPASVTRRILREAAARDGNSERPPVVVRRLHSAIRNETFRSYRESTRATYKENRDVVKSWRWVSRQSPTTCVICWANDGRLFPLSVPFSSHINCRCVTTPCVDDDEEYVDGPTAFDALEPGVQRGILGDRSFEAFASGQVKELQDFVEVVRSRKWGDMRVLRSLDELLNSKKTAA